MSDTTKSILKICKVCGRDCSAIPRVKNSHGHYFCKTCHDALAAKAAAADAVRRSQSESGDSYGVTGEADNSFYAENALVACPKCGRPSPKQTVVCTACGFNWQTGDQLSVQEVQDESSAERPGSNTRVEYAKKREAAARAMWKYEHFKAIGLLVGGLFATMVVLGTLWGSDGDYVVAGYFVGFGINWLVGAAAFWLCSITFLGVDAPFYLNALRLGAAYAISDLALYGTMSFISPCLAFFVMLGCYLGLLMTLFELDLTDAALLAISLFAVKLVIFFTTAMLIATYAT